MRESGSFVWETTLSTVACVLIAGIGAAIVAWFSAAGLQSDVPQYQRRVATEAACKAAGEALSRLPGQSGITFIDDCGGASITPVSNRPGLVIVRRTIQGGLGEPNARRTFSALMDGRAVDAWRAVRIESAPNELSVIVSPPALAETPEVAAYPTPPIWSR